MTLCSCSDRYATFFSAAAFSACQQLRLLGIICLGLMRKYSCCGKTALGEIISRIVSSKRRYLHGVQRRAQLLHLRAAAAAAAGQVGCQVLRKGGGVLLGLRRRGARLRQLLLQPRDLVPVFALDLQPGLSVISKPKLPEAPYCGTPHGSSNRRPRLCSLLTQLATLLMWS